MLILMRNTGDHEDLCPDGGDIGYWDGKVKCSVHPRDDGSENDDGDDGTVPFL